jgi:hypothetical protein
MATAAPRIITIAYAPTGKASILHGTEVPYKEQLAKWRKYKLGRLPEGVARVEVWQGRPRAVVAAKPAPKSDAKGK